MSPWLTFVVGIIIGLLIGWAIDLLYRRWADMARDMEAVESPELLAVETEGSDQTLPSVEPVPPEPPGAGIVRPDRSVAPEMPVEPEPPAEAEVAKDPEERGRQSPPPAG